MSDESGSYVLAGGQSFYIRGESDVQSALVSSGGFYLGNSLFRRPPQTGGDTATLTSFVANVDDVQLRSWSRQQRTRINLRPGVPNSFWTAHGGFDSQAGQPEIIEMDLTNDNLRLLLAGAGGKLRATFWIDIARKVLTRTEMDGKVVFADK
jgi:hypothetical protein